MGVHLIAAVVRAVIDAVRALGVNCVAPVSKAERCIDVVWVNVCIVADGLDPKLLITIIRSWLVTMQHLLEVVF